MRKFILSKQPIPRSIVGCHLIVFRFYTLGLLALTIACDAEPQPAPTPTGTAVAYDGAHVIIGDRSDPISVATIIVDNGTIVDIGRQGDVSTPTGATIVDLSGKTVMPALVNLHGHVGFQRGLTYDAANYTQENIVDHLNQYAYHGVGVIVSLGTDAGDLWQDISRDQEAGRLGGTRLQTAAREARPGANTRASSPTNTQVVDIGTLLIPLNTSSTRA